MNHRTRLISHRAPAGRILARGLLVASVSLLPLGCRAEDGSTSKQTQELTVYCSVDEAFARPILDKFEARTQSQLAIVFDTEAGKTTGLVNRIIQEEDSGRPRADVFWSSEVFNTIALARRGLLVAHPPGTATDIPARFKDPDHFWTGLAVRARVIAFDPARQPNKRIPRRWLDLAAPQFAGRLAFANPLFGTTRGHVAAMLSMWGRDKTAMFLTRMRDHGMTLVDGNSAAVRALIAGRVDLAATDTDDVWVAQRSGAQVELVYPDMGRGGTLLVPCSVAIVRGTAHLQLARELVDYLVSAEVERELATSTSRNIPVRETLRQELKIDWPAESVVDYAAIADVMDEAAALSREILLR